jgi:hypothetical protein
MSEIPKGNKKISTPIKIAAVVLLVGLVLFLQRFSYSNDDFEKVMKLISKQMNQSCPKMEDKDTRLDNTETRSALTFQYNYTMVEMLRDSMDVELLNYSFETAMINNARTNPDLEMFRKHNVTLVYSFKDKLGNFLTKISITPEKYRR